MLGAAFDERNSLPALRHVGDLLCFGVVWQPVAQEMLWGQRGKKDSTKYQQILGASVPQSVKKSSLNYLMKQNRLRF